MQRISLYIDFDINVGLSTFAHFHQRQRRRVGCLHPAARWFVRWPYFRRCCVRLRGFRPSDKKYATLISQVFDGPDLNLVDPRWPHREPRVQNLGGEVLPPIRAGVFLPGSGRDLDTPLTPETRVADLLLLALAPLDLRTDFFFLQTGCARCRRLSAPRTVWLTRSCSPAVALATSQ